MPVTVRTSCTRMQRTSTRRTRSQAGAAGTRSRRQADEQGRQDLQRHLQASRMHRGRCCWQPVSTRQHALQGTDFNTVWNERTRTTRRRASRSRNGPFILSNYTKGQSITMTRNPKWWGPHAPYLDKVVFVFRTNTDTEIQAIRGGEVDAIYPQPQLQLVDLKGSAGTQDPVERRHDPRALRLQRAAEGRLPARAARRGSGRRSSYSINRQASSTRSTRSSTRSSGSCRTSRYGNSQTGKYQPHFGQYSYSPAKVAGIMQKHGCTKGGDGIFVV